MTSKYTCSLSVTWLRICAANAIVPRICSHRQLPDVAIPSSSRPLHVPCCPASLLRHSRPLELSYCSQRDRQTLRPALSEISESQSVLCACVSVMIFDIVLGM